MLGICTIASADNNSFRTKVSYVRDKTLTEWSQSFPELTYEQAIETCKALGASLPSHENAIELILEAGGYLSTGTRKEHDSPDGVTWYPFRDAHADQGTFEKNEKFDLLLGFDDIDFITKSWTAYYYWLERDPKTYSFLMIGTADQSSSWSRASVGVSQSLRGYFDWSMRQANPDPFVRPVRCVRLTTL